MKEKSAATKQPVSLGEPASELTADELAEFKSAQEAQKAFRAEGKLGPTGPLFRYVAGKNLEALHKRFQKSKSGFDVLEGVRICANHELAMPRWLAEAFIERYDAVLTARAGSWDDHQAFGEPYKKGVHLSAIRKARLGRIIVHTAVCDELSRNPSVAIDKALFEKIGKEHGYGATLAADYYYDAINLLGMFNPAKS